MNQFSEKKTLFTIAIVCPSCGVSLSFREGNTKVVCSHCGSSYMIIGLSGVKRFFIPERISRGDALAAVSALLRKKEEGEKEKSSIELVSSNLVFFPLYRIATTGALYHIAEKPESTLMMTADRGGDAGEVLYKKPKEVHAEVTVREGNFFTPAGGAAETGVPGIATTSQILELHNLNIRELSNRGAVFTPMTEVKTAERRAWASFIASAHMGNANVIFQDYEEISEDVSQIYYPLWMVRFFVDDMAHLVTVDGVGGSIIKANILRKTKTNPVPALLFLGAISFIACAVPLLAPPITVLVISLFIITWVFFKDVFSWIAELFYPKKNPVEEVRIG